MEPYVRSALDAWLRTKEVEMTRLENKIGQIQRRRALVEPHNYDPVEEALDKFHDALNRRNNNPRSLTYSEQLQRDAGEYVTAVKTYINSNVLASPFNVFER